MPTPPDALGEFITAFEMLGPDAVELYGGYESPFSVNLNENASQTLSGSSITLPSPLSLPVGGFTSLGQAKKCLNALSEASNQLHRELFQLAEHHLGARDRDSSQQHTTLSPAAKLCVVHCLSRTIASATGSAGSTLLSCLRELQTAYDSWLAALEAFERRSPRDADNVPQMPLIVPEAPTLLCFAHLQNSG